MNTNKIDLIKAEVARIQLYTQSEVLKDILDYIDKVQEEPASDDLEEAAEKYAYELFPSVGVANTETELAFKAGAKWQFNQLEKNRLTACDRASKEEIEREQDFCDKIIIGEHRQPTFSDAIEYGIKWQKEQDIKHGYVTFLQGEKHFANSILEMINNGWHIVAIKTACNDKIKED